MIGPKYLPHYLEHLLEEYLGETRMEDLVKPCLIPAYNIVSGEAMFFNQMNAYRDESFNFLVREVVRGSTAAPTYFPVAKISDVLRGELALIDGGMFANNPALCAFIEACKFPFNPSEEDILIFLLEQGRKRLVMNMKRLEIGEIFNGRYQRYLFTDRQAHRQFIIS